MRYVDEYRAPEQVMQLVAHLQQRARLLPHTAARPLRIMEVCGGHTHAIFKFGLDQLLPERDIVEAPRTPAVLPEEGEDEYQLIVRVLKESNGVVAGPKGAAQRLGLKRTTLLSRMKRLGINKDELV